MELIVTQVTYI